MISPLQSFFPPAARKPLVRSLRPCLIPSLCLSAALALCPLSSSQAVPQSALQADLDGAAGPYLQAPVQASPAPSSGPQGPKAQTPRNNANTLTVYTYNVLLDVSVNDKKGQPVRGLTRDDFTILDGGVPQKIVYFQPTEPKLHTIPIHSTAELDRLEPEAPVTIVVLDELTTSFEDEYFARYSLEKYLSTQGTTLNQPMMLIARTVDRTMVLHDYTTSKKEILDALHRHLVGNDWRSQNPDWTSEQTAAAFASLIQIAKATQGHPGHKNLIWIGRGFPAINWLHLPHDQSDVLQSAIAYCVNLLRDARITLYTIDPKGVAVEETATLDQNGAAVLDDPFGGQTDFGTIALATGGQVLHGRNDVDHMIGSAVSDGEFFYTIAYKPSFPVTDDPEQFRKIQVALRDKSLVATTRQGYFSVPPGKNAPNDELGDLSQQSSFDLSSAISGLMVYDGIPLTIVRDNTNPNTFHIALPASAIGLQDESGKMTGKVTVIAVSYDRAGKLLNQSGAVLSLQLAPLPSGKEDSRSIPVTASLDTTPPAARIRFVVRSDANGKIGTGNLFLVDRETLKDPVTGLKTQKAHPE